FKLAQNPLLMLPVGAVMFVLYYSLGVFFIKKFNLPTIGRESEEEIAAAKVALISNDSVEMQYINALGGADNLINVDACTTRLRLVVRSSENINKPILKALGAKGFVTPAPDSVQVILGPQAEIIASKIRDTLNQLGRNLTIQSAEKAPLAVTKVAPVSVNVSAVTEILSALGGKSNLKSINLVALTRAKIELKDEKTIDLAKLKAQGVIEVINLNSKTKQLYIGVAAENIVAGINQLIK
ncbi:MAG: glucose PTS transporter subunit EIIB, partial [Burkholderiales bacterium]|nr:glucose PTS transporter subunit EIIB [Burkholderiales bacterium]